MKKFLITIVSIVLCMMPRVSDAVATDEDVENLLRKYYDAYYLFADNGNPQNDGYFDMLAQFNSWLNYNDDNSLAGVVIKICDTLKLNEIQCDGFATDLFRLVDTPDIIAKNFKGDCMRGGYRKDITSHCGLASDFANGEWSAKAPNGGRVRGISRCGISNNGYGIRGICECRIEGSSDWLELDTGWYHNPAFDCDMDCSINCALMAKSMLNGTYNSSNSEHTVDDDNEDKVHDPSEQPNMDEKYGKVEATPTADEEEYGEEGHMDEKYGEEGHMEEEYGESSFVDEGDDEAGHIQGKHYKLNGDCYCLYDDSSEWRTTGCDCSDMKKGTWWRIADREYEGEARCSITKGNEYRDIGDPADIKGSNCWCRSVAGSWWFYNQISNDADCNDLCDEYCYQELN